jgi:hypothetical protein
MSEELDHIDRAMTAHHRRRDRDGMHIRGVHIETLHDPCGYTHAQIEKARKVAQLLRRGKLVLVEPPKR